MATGTGSISAGDVTVNATTLQNEQLNPIITFSLNETQAVTYNSESLVLSATVNSYVGFVTSAALSINDVGFFTGNYNQVSDNEFVIEIQCDRTGQLSLTAVSDVT